MGANYNNIACRKLVLASAAATVAATAPTLNLGPIGQFQNQVPNRAPDPWDLDAARPLATRKPCGYRRGARSVADQSNAWSV
jgi:hypothetical protein